MTQSPSSPQLMKEVKICCSNDVTSCAHRSEMGLEHFFNLLDRAFPGSAPGKDVIFSGIVLGFEFAVTVEQRVHDDILLFDIYVPVVRSVEVHPSGAVGGPHRGRLKAHTSDLTTSWYTSEQGRANANLTTPVEGISASIAAPMSLSMPLRSTAGSSSLRANSPFRPSPNRR